MKNVGPIRHSELPHAGLPFTRCRYCHHCRTPPAHRCPRRRRRQRQRVTEGNGIGPTINMIKVRVSVRNAVGGTSILNRGHFSSLICVHVIAEQQQQQPWGDLRVCAYVSGTAALRAFFKARRHSAASGDVCPVQFSVRRFLSTGHNARRRRPPRNIRNELVAAVHRNVCTGSTSFRLISQRQKASPLSWSHRISSWLLVISSPFSLPSIVQWLRHRTGLVTQWSRVRAPAAALSSNLSLIHISEPTRPY